MGDKSRNKGQRGEREAAAKLIELFGCDAERGRQHHGRDDAPDVLHSIPGVHVEVKRTEKLAAYPAIDQARADSDKIPLVLHRRNQREWLAIVPLDDLPQLASLLYLFMASEGE